MDLTDFITTTLISIKDGIKNANEKDPTTKPFKMNPGADVIKFDVAVEVSDERTKEKGGGIKVIQVAEGKLSDSSTSKEANISRIIFSVGLNSMVH